MDNYFQNIFPKISGSQEDNQISIFGCPHLSGIALVCLTCQVWSVLPVRCGVGLSYLSGVVCLTCQVWSVLPVRYGLSYLSGVA